MVDNRFDNLTTIDGGHVVKMEVDYSTTCDEKIPMLKEQAKRGPSQYRSAIDSLMQLEKQTRIGADMASCTRVLIAIVQICFEADDWESLNENIQILVKRRSQIKQAVVKMVQECMTYVKKTPNKETTIKLIDTLRMVTEGKIYVEVERARLTQMLAVIKEEDGDLTGACSIMEELQVETYGTMEKREKVDLIIEQMRLCLLKEDYVRTAIIAKKISVKFFEDPNQQDLKFKYYGLMIRVDQDQSYLRTARHYLAVVDSSVIAEAPERRQRMITCACFYCVLSPFDNEQQDLMIKLSKNKLLDETPMYKDILKMFMSKELMSYETLMTQYGTQLMAFDILSTSRPHGVKCWEDLKSRIAEHNIRLIATYYTRITIKRMSELLRLSINETEEYLTNLTNDKSIKIKMHRPTGIVQFKIKKAEADTLNDWADGISELMLLVNKTCHLINKEECIHNVMIAA